MAAAPPPSNPIASTGGAASRRDPWEIPAVVAGMRTMLARRAALLADGATPIGWKLAFGTEAAMEKLGTTGPLVGFLTDATLLADGAEVSVADWAAPKLEPEIAIHLGPGGKGVAGVSSAIELADADLPPTETETVLAGDIYHRAVVLDAAAPSRANHAVVRDTGPSRSNRAVVRDAPAPTRSTDPTAAPNHRFHDTAAPTLPAQPSGDPAPIPRPIAAKIERDGEEIAATTDAEAEVGRIEDLAAWTVTYLRHFGIETAEGEVLISGSVVPLLDIAAGQHLRHEIAGVGALTVSIAAD